jgi:hypothetical protein
VHGLVPGDIHVVGAVVVLRQKLAVALQPTLQALLLLLVAVCEVVGV